jgi:hypothetical protein
MSLKACICNLHQNYYVLTQVFFLKVFLQAINDQGIQSTDHHNREQMAEHAYQ